MNTTGRLISCVVTNLGEGLRKGKGRKGGQEEDRQGRGKRGKGMGGRGEGKKGEGKERKGQQRKVRRNCYFITSTYLFYMKSHVYISNPLEIRQYTCVKYIYTNPR